MNETVFCDCVMQSGARDTHRTRSPLRRLESWVRHLSGRTPAEIEQRLDMAKTRALLLSMGMPSKGMRWGQ